MLRKSAWLVTGAAVATFASTASHAAYIGALRFTEPTGTVLPTGSVEVRLRFTLDSTSDNLFLNGDPGSTPPFGVPPGNYGNSFFDENNVGYVVGVQVASFTYTSLDNAFLNTFYECTGTFTDGCGPAAYSFEFNTSGPESINFLNTFNLPAGQSYDYLFGSFTPEGGAAPAGTYVFRNSGLTLNFAGAVTAEVYALDENGQWIQAVDENGDPVVDGNGDPVYVTTSQLFNNSRSDILLGQTCAFGTTCVDEFTRTVVPIPPAIWLFGSALGVMGLTRRKFAG